jgi:hypothetical protein
MLMLVAVTADLEQNTLKQAVINAGITNFLV